MHYYKIFGVAFKSNFKLSVLPETDSTDFEFELSEVNITPKTEDTDWYLKIPYKDYKDSIFAQLGKNENHFALRFKEYLDFFISKDFKKIWFSNKNDIDINTLQHLLIDQVIPRIISDDRSIVFHASAIEYKNKVIAFIGESGSGKSTSVLALSNQSKNINFLCDDSILIKKCENSFLSIPSYSAIRVWPDSANKLQRNKHKSQKVSAINNKLILYEKTQNIDFSPKTLAAVYNLNPENNKKISIKKMTSKKAFEEMTKGIFRLDVYNRDELRKEFSFVSQLTQNINFFDIYYKKDFDLINSFTEEITKHILSNT